MAAHVSNQIVYFATVRSMHACNNKETTKNKDKLYLILNPLSRSYKLT